MPFRHRPYMLFLGLAVAMFVVAHVGFEVYARLLVGRNGLSEALHETLYYSAIQPIGSMMLLAPFLFLGWMAASLAKKKTMKVGMLLFAVGVTILTVMYFKGHIGAQQAMLAHKWTAAALSVGLLPFQSIPVLFIMLVVYLLMARKRNGNEI